MRASNTPEHTPAAMMSPNNHHVTVVLQLLARSDAVDPCVRQRNVTDAT